MHLIRHLCDNIRYKKGARSWVWDGVLSFNTIDACLPACFWLLELLNGSPCLRHQAIVTCVIAPLARPPFRFTSKVTLTSARALISKAAGLRTNWVKLQPRSNSEGEGIWPGWRRHRPLARIIFDIHFSGGKVRSIPGRVGRLC
jgi:hypothetical protein